MENKEIIIITTALGNDGAERVLTELSNEWVRTGNKVTVVETGTYVKDNSYVLDQRVERINIHIERKNCFQWYYREVKAVVKLLRQRKDATALAFLSQSFYILYIASLFCKNKIVFSERNDPSRWPASWMRRKLRDLAFCRANKCVFQTKEALAHFPVKIQKKGIIIPNPVNPYLPKPFIGERKKVIISAGRLHPQKNFSMLINAFCLLHYEYPDYYLEIYGEGEERVRLEQMICRLEMQKYISLPGFTNNIHEIIRSSAIYVCSSDYEGISNSMLEALGMGVPTISTDCSVGGAREMIESGKNGLLVPVGDVEALYLAMKLLIEEPEFSINISQNACTICEKYKISAISKKWIMVL